MKMLLYISLLFSQFGHAQNLELYGGVNFNSAFAFPHTEYLSKVIKLKYGVNIGILTDLNVGKRVLKIGLSYENYSGDIESGWYGYSGYNKTKGTYNNQTISAEFYPLQIIRKKLEWSLGTKISYRINSQINGYNASYSISGSSYKSQLESTEGRKLILGLQTLIAFPINLNNQWTILPKLHIYQGITSDYRFYDKIYKRWISPQIGIRRIF